MFHVIEKYRLTKGEFASDSSYGNAGVFVIPHYKIDGYIFQVIASEGEGWEHASISLDSYKRKVERCPTWEEMCFIKSLFWDEEDCVIEFHPPKSHYVSHHAYCLHLWRPTDFIMPIPPTDLVGTIMKA